jgi:hypothetical protein
MEEDQTTLNRSYIFLDITKKILTISYQNDDAHVLNNERKCTIILIPQKNIPESPKKLLNYQT